MKFYLFYNFKMTKKQITTLSLFDGISCGKVALDRLGYSGPYYASEIEKFPIEISRKNHPEIIQLGDVQSIFWLDCWFCKQKTTDSRVYKSEEGKEKYLWYNYCNSCNRVKFRANIDLLLGGSPCQGFSFAWKQLNFEDPRSKLFFEYARLLKEIKPKYFLLENVKMKKEYQEIISKHLFWVFPQEVCSSLVSAQTRKRLYWFWELQEDGSYKTVVFPKPEDKKIYLQDILEDGFSDRNKSLCLDANYFKWWNLKQYFEKKRRQLVFDWLIHIWNADIKWMDCIKRVYDPKWKSPTLTTMGWGHREPKVAIYQIPHGDNKGWIKSENWKVPCMTTAQWHFNNLLITEKWEEVFWRKLTPIECERLQTLPDNYTAWVSNTQRYKALWNGWTADVIAYILSFMKF